VDGGIAASVSVLFAWPFVAHGQNLILQNPCVEFIDTFFLQMPTLRRRALSRQDAKRTNAAPVVIDLLDDDFLPVAPSEPEDNGDNPIDDTYEDEEDMKPIVAKRTAKRTAKKGGRAKKTANRADSEPSIMPVTSDIPKSAVNPMLMRRAVTLPISQVKSKTTTALKPSSASNSLSLLSNNIDSPYESNGKEEEEEEDFSTYSTQPSSHLTSITNGKATMEEEVPFDRQATLPFSASSLSSRSTNISSQVASLPSKLPSSQSQDTSSESKFMKSSGSSSLFRFRDSINLNLVKNCDVDELSHIGSGGLKRSAPQLSSLKQTINDVMTLDSDSENDEIEANMMFSGSVAKKHCGPGRRASASKLSHPLSASASSDYSSSTMTTSAVTSSSSPTTTTTTTTTKKESQSMKNSDHVSSPSTADKKTTAKGKTPINPDDVLDEYLGANNMDYNVTVEAARYHPYASQTDHYAKNEANLARSYLQEVRRTSATTTTSSTTTTPTYVSSYPKHSSTSNRGGNSGHTGAFQLTLKIGLQNVGVQAKPSETSQTLLNRLQAEGKLPIMLPNETLFLKFDNIPLVPTATMDESFVANGDELLLAVRRDGREVMDPFGGVNDDEDDGGGMQQIHLDNADKISLSARYPDAKTIIRYRIGKDEPLQKLADAAAKKLNVPVSHIQVIFDGVSLKLTQSSNELYEPLQDEDIVEIQVKKS
jgi:hypothetical protein